jgi:hypothetical protein
MRFVASRVRDRSPPHHTPSGVLAVGEGPARIPARPGSHARARTVNRPRRGTGRLSDGGHATAPGAMPERALRVARCGLVAVRMLREQTGIRDEPSLARTC